MAEDHGAEPLWQMMPSPPGEPGVVAGRPLRCHCGATYVAHGDGRPGGARRDAEDHGWVADLIEVDLSVRWLCPAHAHEVHRWWA